MSTMHLIEIFLPVADNSGKPFDQKLHRELRRELTEQFGGVTAFARAALGEDKQGRHIVQDRITILEVITEEVDRGWWTNYRKRLEAMFEQEEILIRATAIEKL
jgi:hypothetical protein